MVSPRPVPDTPVLERYGSEDALYREFVARAAGGRLQVQKCADCGYLRWPPTRSCPECWSPAWDWHDIDRAGEIWSVAVYERDYGAGRPLPYNVVLVRMDAGVTMLSTVVDADDLSLAPGQRVVADLDGPGLGLAQVVFRRTEPNA